MPHLISGIGYNSIIHLGYQPDTKVDNVNYYYLDLEDNAQSAERYFQDIMPKALLYIKNELDQGKKVLISCSAGRSRSVTLAICYLLTYRSSQFKLLDHKNKVKKRDSKDKYKEI